MEKRFFKAFNIKERWWDSHYDYDQLSIGHYSSYKDLYKSLRYNNGWNDEETKETIRKDCYKDYPRLTDEVILKLITLLSSNMNLMTLGVVKDKQDLINFVLTKFIQNKERFKEDIENLFPMPNNKVESDLIELDDGGQDIY